MHTYALAAVAIVILSSMVLAYILKRNNLFNIRLFLSAVVSSIVVSLLFPFLLGRIYGSAGFITSESGIIPAFLIAFLIYLILLFVISFLISFFISDKKLNQVFSNRGMGFFQKAYDEVSSILGQQLRSIISPTFQKPDDENEETRLFEQTKEETRSHDLMELNINECIDEAFRLKEQGDFEGAILYYMYALDKNPDKGLTFWIVLDVCTMYKFLGQVELSRGILEEYLRNYSEIMDKSLIAEIKKNLV
jgi:tetratricopeptide (TPR) repeat protein